MALHGIQGHDLKSITVVVWLMGLEVDDPRKSKQVEGRVYYMQGGRMYRCGPKKTGGKMIRVAEY